MYNRIIQSAVILFLLLLTSCGKNESYRIPIEPVSPITITRFDLLIDKYVHLHDSVAEAELIASVGPFWNVYNRHILRLDDAPRYLNGLHKFYNEYSKIGVIPYAISQYADVKEECLELAKLSARYNKLFPNQSSPCYQFHISGLRNSIVTMDSLISISIDCYLDDEEWYAYRYHDYELPYHNRSRILPDVAEVLVRNSMTSNECTTLLDALVYEGKVAYLMSGLIDDNSITAVLGYTDEQASWCWENEPIVWSKIVENGDLYESNNIIINKYINPAPFTATLTSDSPGRVGRWIGWRIVEKYAHNQHLTPQQIATDTTAAIDVLRLSGYDGK